MRPVIHRLGTVDSTMTIAARMAEEGCPAGTAVVADEQTAGQGRHGRSWHSEAGAGLYCTIVLRPNVPPDSMPVVTLALGLAVAEAITQTASVDVDLRWPNDVLLGGKKVAGILVQLQGDAMLAGIGINVNHERFPEELAGIATSLRIATGRTVDKEAVLQQLLPAVNSHIALLEREGREPILRLFERGSSYVRGRRVAVDQGPRVLRGTTDGLDPAGFLILRDDRGERSLVLAGGVRPE